MNKKHAAAPVATEPEPSPRSESWESMSTSHCPLHTDFIQGGVAWGKRKCLVDLGWTIRRKGGGKRWGGKAGGKAGCRLAERGSPKGKL